MWLLSLSGRMYPSAQATHRAISASMLGPGDGAADAVGVSACESSPAAPAPGPGPGPGDWGGVFRTFLPLSGLACARRLLSRRASRRCASVSSSRPEVPPAQGARSGPGCPPDPSPSGCPELNFGPGSIFDRSMAIDARFYPPQDANREVGNIGLETMLYSM